MVQQQEEEERDAQLSHAGETRHPSGEYMFSLAAVFFLFITVGTSIDQVNRLNVRIHCICSMMTNVFT